MRISLVNFLSIKFLIWALFTFFLMRFCVFTKCLCHDFWFLYLFHSQLRDCGNALFLHKSFISLHILKLYQPVLYALYFNETRCLWVTERNTRNEDRKKPTRRKISFKFEATETAFELKSNDLDGKLSSYIFCYTLKDVEINQEQIRDVKLLPRDSNNPWQSKMRFCSC